MKRTTKENSNLVCTLLLGAMVASEAMAADIRYMNSGDYLEPTGWQGGVIPGTNDTARFNWGNNTVTLAGEAPLLMRFQMGVDESGQLVVNSGGKLNTTGVQNSTVGNNNNAGVVGRLTINAGGEVNVTNVLFVGASATGIVTNDGGILRITSHLWGGSGANGVGTIAIANGGTVSVGGNIGLGTVNASTPSGGKCSLYVLDGGVLNLNQISPVNSIQPNSVLDLSGSGVVTIPNDVTTVISDYTNALRITAYGGLGTVGIDYNNTNAGMTTLFAIAPLSPPPTEVVWNPAANPSGTGKWNEPANWTGSVAPANVTKVTFNVVGAIPCTVTNAALADYVVMGDNGPGGTLIITNGGRLTAGAANATAIGNNSNALMVVESGGSASFGTHLWIGLDPGSDGTLIMNGGTVSVSGMFGLGWQGGKGTAHINGGTLNLSQWDYFNSIQGESVLDVSGTGKVVIDGNQQDSVNNFILTGQITNHTGTPLVADYNNIVIGKTTIYSSDVYLPPAQATWNPALNPDGNGWWNVSSNWSAGILPGSVTFVYLNVFDAIPCIVTNAVSASVVRIGLNGPGGTMIITNGGSLVCNNPDEWNSIGMNSPNTGLLVVENGGSASYANHLWIGFDAGTEGTLIMNGGTVTVGQMMGLGWNGGKGTAHINGGTFNLSQWSESNPGSIAGESSLDVAGTGKVVITGDHFNSVSNYVSAGKITANGGPNVFYSYDPGANKTTISAVLLPAPQQSITSVSVSGGNVSLTYQTTHQHTYYVEGSPSLSPAVWTPVAGSTNAATGTPVTFVFPASPGQSFYRTVAY
jgi:hypothetical protein